MDLMQAMHKRHSVRSYLDQPIAGKVKEELQAWFEKCNQESGLDMQLVLNEPKAFDGFMGTMESFLECETILHWLERKTAIWKKHVVIMARKWCSKRSSSD